MTSSNMMVFGRLLVGLLILGAAGCALDDVADPVASQSAAVSACDDGNPCTTDTSDAYGACSHAPLSGTACTDDGNSCTTDVCAQGACTHPFRAEHATCASDGNSCTEDFCRIDYARVRPTKPVPQAHPIFIDCVHEPYPNGTTCGEGGPCATCMAGECIPGTC